MNKKLIGGTELTVLSVFLNNLNKKIHGRQIAKELKANQRTILLTLNRLEENHILTSEKIGKNRDFSLNKKNEITKIYVIMAEQFKCIQLFNENFKIYSIITSIQEISEGIIIIFGSHARKQERKESDLDILIIGKINKERLSGIKNKSPIKIQLLNISKKEFINGIKDKKPFMLEIISAHIITLGYEAFTRMRWKYG